MEGGGIRIEQHALRMVPHKHDMQTLMHAVTTKVCMTFYISPYDDR